MGLTDAAAVLIAQKLIGTGTTDYDAANTYLGVGDSSTAFVKTQQDLVAATNKLKKLVNATPSRTGAALTFVALFTTAEANFAWNEWAVFNGSGAGGAGPTGVVMLNRKVESLGTKTSAQAWQLTVTVTPTAA
jgi:hypothetical protein